MSFILDALKKSELERQRQTNPGLMDPGAIPHRARLPRWVIALGLLLGLNLVVLSVALLRNGAPVPPAAAPVATKAATATTATTAATATTATTATTAPTPAATPQSAPVVAAEPDHFSPLDPPAATASSAAPPVYAPEIPVESADDAAPAPPPHAHAPKATHKDPLLTDSDGSDDTEVLPSMSELNLTGPQGLPELHIDVHVYATRPSDRFVYINMRKYREGATLQEGPVLERIRRDGAVLDYHGLRFILPRQ